MLESMRIAYGGRGGGGGLTCRPLSTVSGFSSCFTFRSCSSRTTSALPLVGWSLNLE
jgi:hypothetical protein